MYKQTDIINKIKQSNPHAFDLISLYFCSLVYALFIYLHKRFENYIVEINQQFIFLKRQCVGQTYVDNKRGTNYVHCVLIIKATPNQREFGVGPIKIQPSLKIPFSSLVVRRGRKYIRQEKNLHP